MSYKTYKLPLLLLILVLLLCIKIQTLTAPTWITSQQFQGGTLKVIDGDVCDCQKNQNQLSATFVTSFSATPMIVVGACSIDGTCFFTQPIALLGRLIFRFRWRVSLRLQSRLMWTCVRICGLYRLAIQLLISYFLIM